MKRLYIGLSVFLILNLADCLMTWYLIYIGGSEGNWYSKLLGVMPVEVVLALKMGIALSIALLVYRYRSRLFKFLNLGMGVVVGINAIPLMAYLIGRFAGG